MALTRAGRRVIALDNRGHGASSELYDPAAYHSATTADDVRALLDHLAIERADATQMQHADEKCLAINGGRRTLTPRRFES